MSKKWLALGILVGAAAAAAPFLGRLRDDSSVPVLTVSRSVLGNGMTLLVHDNPHATMAAISVWYRTGARFDPPGKSGLAHLSEHVMGFGLAPDGPHLCDEADALTAKECNASTGYDRTRFFMTVPAKALEKALRIEATRIARNSRDLMPGHLEKAVAELEREIEPKGAAPDLSLTQRILWSTAKAVPGYNRLPLGALEEIRSITLDDVKMWFDGQFRIDHAIVSVAGNIGATNVPAIVEQTFGRIPPARAPAASSDTAPAGPTTPQLPDAPPTTIDGPEDRLFVVWNVPGFTSPDADYLDLVQHILGERLRTRVVEAEKAAKLVDVKLVAYEHFGQLRLQVQPTGGTRVGRASALVHEEITKFKENGPSRSEIAGTASQLIASIVEDLNRPDKCAMKADLIAQSEMFYGGASMYVQSFQRMRTATTEQVRETARRWLGPHFELRVVAAK
jgi:zinc protease